MKLTNSLGIGFMMLCTIVLQWNNINAQCSPDNIPPVCNATDITVQLDDDGMVTLDPYDFDGGPINGYQDISSILMGDGYDHCDLNNDGNLDLIVINTLALDFIFIGDGHGNFINSGIDLGFPGDNDFGIHLEDLDGDGDCDIVKAGDPARIYENDGSGNFSSIGSLSSWGIASEVKDLDSDGLLDIIAGTPTGIVIYKNLGGFSFNQIDFFANPGANIAETVKTGDLDNDGDCDFAVMWGADGTYLYENDGSGIFTEHPFSNYRSGLDLVDVDCDGLLDYLLDGDSFINTGNIPVVMVGQTGLFLSLAVRERNCAHSNPVLRDVFSFKDTLIQPQGGGFNIGEESADFNNDGVLDLIYRACSGNTFGIMLSYMTSSGFEDNCGIDTITAFPSTVDCDDVSDIVMVTLNVTDLSGNSAQCTANVTVEDNLAPQCNTNADIIIGLPPNECDAEVFYDLPLITDNCNNSPLVTLLPGQPAPGSVFPIGTTTIQYLVDDQVGNSQVCSFDIIVNGYQAGAMSCEDINVSLDPFTCYTSLTPQMILTSQIGCPDNCVIIIWDEYGNEIPNRFDISHVGRSYTYEICCDGNCCWGEVSIEYKTPPRIDCPRDITVSCSALSVLDIPPAVAGCSAFEVSLFKEDRETFNCDSLYTSVVTRTYVARDEYGNTDSCTHRIYLERLNLDNIVFPESYSVGTGNAISCKDNLIEFDEEGVPLPWPTDPITGSGTGVPILCDPYITNGVYCPTSMDYSGTPLIPHGLYMGQTTIPTGQACSAAVTYTDIEFPKLGCVRKFMRTWEVREWWCNGENTVGGIQLIEIVDDQAPEFECPRDFTVSTNYDCAGSVLMPSVYAHDECGTVLDYRIDYPNGLLQANGGHIELELGLNTVEYIVSDDCYNSSNCFVDVTVQDNTNPVAICELYKVISLGQGGEAIVFAEPFDNGSWDECYLDRFEVRRMDTTCVAADTLFDESVTFCCSDLGEEVMVVFRAWDKAQNYNDCMVRVEVQDKLIPDFDCPPDLTIDCHDIYDFENLDLTFGALVTYDNCASQQVEEIVIDDVNQCGIGTIQRIFEYKDAFGNVLRHCKQVITITNNTPFVGANIIWPLDYEVEGGCSIQDLSPENLPEPYGFPTFTAGDDECSLIGYDYDDKFFEAPPGSGECGKIERTWTVINWCGQTAGVFDIWVNPKPQYIKLINTVAPEIEPQDDLVFESQNIDCINGDIVVERSATDDCQNLLFWTFVVRDINDYIVATGNTNFLVDTLPSGSYNIEWTVTDGCGNFDVDYQNVEVINTKAPSPVCISGLAANLVLMDLDSDGTFDAEMVELWAEDFDAKSYHTCSNPITLSLSRDINDISRIYDCDDIGINTVQLWVTDLITGAQAYCETFVDIQDNNGDNVCDSTDMQNRVVIQGDIYTEYNDEIEGVEVGIGIPELEVMTSEDGEYAFSSMPMGGNYQVIPRKDDEHLNGISTLDLILIQRHILGVEWLDSPYKMIAADVNGNQEISSVDLIELRKLILGVYSELPENEAWRFVDAEYTFIDPLNPWIHLIPEDYMIQNLNTDMDIDFIGVKVGDVNGSVVANSNEGNIENRNSDALKLAIDNNWIEAGEIATIKIAASNYTDILGWQTAIRFDVEMMNVLEVVAPFENWSDSNYYIDSEKGIITISYHAHEASSLDNTEAMIELLIESKQNLNTTRALDLDQTMMNIEAYSSNAQILPIEIENGNNVNDELAIIGAQPNPFVEQTDITIKVPQEGSAIWQYYDVNGRLLYQTSAFYTKGTHTQSVARSELNASGMVYVNLLMHNKSIQYRLILI